MNIEFIDLKAAFDIVCHASLWSTSPRSTTQDCCLVQTSLHQYTEQWLWFYWFSISSGVRQGCVAAPDLFSCIVDHLMYRVCIRVPGASFSSYHLTDLEYADNTALGVYSKEAEKLELQVSWTKFMHIGAGPAPPALCLGNYILQQVGVSVVNAEPLAQDRQHWKQLVHLVGTTHQDGMIPNPSQEPRWWWWQINEQPQRCRGPNNYNNLCIAAKRDTNTEVQLNFVVVLDMWGDFRIL